MTHNPKSRGRSKCLAVFRVAQGRVESGPHFRAGSDRGYGVLRLRLSTGCDHPNVGFYNRGPAGLPIAQMIMRGCR